MSSYTNIFNGNVVQPTPISYIQINLTANTVLSWSTQFQDTNLAVATILDVIPNNNGFTLTMPDATQTSVGQSVLINNPTGFSFTLNKNDGSTLANIAATTINYFYLIENTTAAGTWRNTPFGGGYTAVTSVNATSLTPNITVSGGPVTTVGTFTFNVGADLAAITGFGNSVGIAARTAANTWALVSLTGTNNQITIANPNGVGGNPTFALASTITGINNLTVGNINITSNTISSTNLNGNISLSPNGNGSITTGPGTPLAFYNPFGTNYISFQGGNLTSNVALTLPTASPIIGQVLGALSSTNLGWLDVSTFGGPSTVNAIARFSNVTGALANSGVLLDNSNNITGANSMIVGNIGISQVDANTITTTNGNGNLNIECNGIGELTVFSPITIKSGNALKIYNIGNSAYNFLAAANTTVTTGWNLPAADGSANSMMKTDAFGNLSFSSILDVIATKTELQTNPPTNATNVMVPTNVQYHGGVLKAWAVFNGTSGTLLSSWNVSNFVKNSTGNYTITYATPFASVNYGISGSVNGNGVVNPTTINTGSTVVVATNFSAVATDFPYICVSAYGLQ